MTRAVTNREIRVESATLDRWNDVVTAFGRRGNDPDWCWCQRFLDRSSQDESEPNNRLALQTEIAQADVAPGLIAYVDGVPAPMGGEMFVARAVVGAPATMSLRDLQEVLEDVATDLLVDVEVKID